MQKGLREFIDLLGKNDELLRVSEPVNPLDIAMNLSGSDKAVLMDVKGYDIPVVGGIMKGREKIALALGCEPNEITEKISWALDHPLDTVMVKEAPCQEIVITGDDVDLTMFPIDFQHEKDGAPYIGSAVQMASWGKWGPNAGMYRHMFRTKNTMGIDLYTPNDMRLYYSQANEEGKPLEVAAAIGLYPTELIAASYSAPTDVNEMTIAGALRGEPLEMAHCKTIDVEVPANAEIVLECEILPDGWCADEGRYGEFHNITGGMKTNPIVRVKAITHRKNPIYYSLHMPNEVHSLNAALLETQAYRLLKSARMRPTAVRAPQGSSAYFELVVALDHPRPGEGKTALLALMSILGVKFVTVVDEDIDIFNDEDLRWALSLRVQPDKDVLIASNVQAKHIDPSVCAHLLPPGRLPVTSKMGIDGTIPPDINRSAYERIVMFRADGKY